MLSPTGPIWYQPGALYGSALKYIVSLSPFFVGAELYTVEGSTRKLCCQLLNVQGDTPRAFLKIPIYLEGKADGGRQVAELVLYSDQMKNEAELDPALRSQVDQIVGELIDLWPVQRKKMGSKKKK